jgi:hypothetical protein
MSIDSIFRAIGALACIYTIGLFVVLTSSAALEAVAHKPAALCAEAACALTGPQQAANASVPDYPYSRVIHTAALFLAGE